MLQKYNSKMSGTILENLSGKKLTILVSFLLLCQLICFLIGGLIGKKFLRSSLFVFYLFTFVYFRQRFVSFSTNPIISANNSRNNM